MLSAEKIQSNWDRLISEINTNISKERSDIVIPFLEKFEERIMMMPAAAKNWHHSAFAGGYVDHVLRVYDCANELYKTWNKMGGDISTYTIEEMHFVALFHDLGKMGQEEGELKNRYEELQNIVTISQTNSLGARGTNNFGNI